MSALSAAPGFTDEIRALLASIRAAEDRLHALTDGQVDALTDTDGRTFLLQRAQEEMRRADAERREAILNSLPANIALLDADGVIVAVNEAWRQFGLRNGPAPRSAGVGANYLEVCRRARGDQSDDASRAAKGLLSVFEGSAKSFSMQYPCHSPSHRKWCQLIATPLSDSHQGGVVVMHMDVTERVVHEHAAVASAAKQKESARQLAHEHERLVAAQRAAKVGSWEINLLTRQVVWSEEMYRIHEMDPGARALSFVRFLSRIPPVERAALKGQIRASMESHEQVLARHPLLLTTGRTKVLEERWQVAFDAAGRAVGAVGTCQDVTASRLAELRIERLNRGYLMLSQISALVTRVGSRDELYSEACRIAVESGGLALAWIGTVDRAQAGITPVASAGAGREFMERLGAQILLDDDSARIHGPAALAVRSGQAGVINDASSNAGARHSTLDAVMGLASTVSLPILLAGEVVAVLTLHADEVDYFDAAEVDLITEVANEIGFAVDHIGKTEQINYLAYFDSLTGLANRSLFLERAAQGLRAAADAGRSALLALIDVERFKSINDSLGVHAGDDLLKQIGTWLGERLGDPGLLARVGSDHFALMLIDRQSSGDAVRNLERLIQAFHEQPFPLEGTPFRIAAKFGVAIFPDDADSAAGLFQKAESALKNAKASGARKLFYTQKMTDSIARKLGQENQLRHALENGEFELHYQPKINLLDGSMIGAEALIRWNDSRTDALTHPGEFIPILEETGLIMEVGRWAIRRAIEDYLRWLGAGLPAVRIAVNVSAMQLRDPRFVDQVRDLVSVDPRAAGGLELEITESMIMTDIEQSMQTLCGLRTLGVRIAIDDFGTGFSSLGYLSKLPVDTLKIDRSFVDEVCVSQQGQTLVSTIITLAHSFGLHVVAEGVETAQQSSMLNRLGCDEAQGYLFSRPLPCGEFETKFLGRKPAPAPAA